MFNFVKNGSALCALLAFGLLAACGSNANTAGPNGPAAESPASTAEASGKTVELTVSAAASLTDALSDIERSFEAAHPNIRIGFNFGASGALQQQIEHGAPADLFFSAAAKNMQALVDGGYIEADRQTDLLANSLVVIVPADGTATVAQESDLTRDAIKKIAVGIPESVPAGSYAKEALTRAALWDELQPKLVQAKDVRQVLQYVETGNADAGFVYRTDAIGSESARIAFEVDPDAYSAIRYPVGIVKTTKHAAEAELLYDYLLSPEAGEIFESYGFAAAGRP
ncbi:molybdate ABC transporter substrate-binding protein [Cohnella algarum]|uniref:molybdate ABC transporter substrate-binding protein n=1 Tax=Cohnella algarum TaxID=2044859 RepID=UPI001966DB9F|nr:molybdate ABC transporter substrate-binding protein [Cohnella algarum]MBN2984052.1 molybdate ABC transporter substrate-binding protein [Cohnella algarum]